MPTTTGIFPIMLATTSLTVDPMQSPSLMGHHGDVDVRVAAMALHQSHANPIQSAPLDLNSTNSERSVSASWLANT